MNDLDYLAAAVHGRVSELAEGRRLGGLCGLRTLPELGRAVLGDGEWATAADFEGGVTEALVWEMDGLVRRMDGPGAALVDWMRERFQVENIKVLLRRLLGEMPVEAARALLVRLPRSPGLDLEELLAARSVEEFLGWLPGGALRKSLRAGLGIHHPGRLRPFFLEGALDRDYLQELLARAERLAGEDREQVRPIVMQEADAFHLGMAVRGRFHYGLEARVLAPLHVRGSRIPEARFRSMLEAPDAVGVLELAGGRAIDEPLPAAGGSEGLEALAWRRFERLCRRALRVGHLGLGAVVGYLGLRRLEAANLLTLSEGVSAGLAPDAVRVRVMERSAKGRVYV